MKRILLLLCILIMIFLSGCYDMREVSEELYAILLSVDKAEEGIRLSAAVPVYGGGEEVETEICQSEGKSIEECLDRLNLALPRKISLLHLKAVIFSEEIAKDGLYEFAEAVQNHMETRSAMGVVISQGEAQKFIENMCEQASGDLSKETELMLLKGRQGTFYPTTLFENFFNDMNSPYRSPSCAYADKKGEICGIAVFTGDKMTLSLNEQESVCLMLAKDRLTKKTFATDDVKMDLESKRAKAYWNEKMFLELTVKCEAKDGISLFSDIRDRLKNDVRDVLIKCGEKGADPAGIKGKCARSFVTIKKWQEADMDFKNISVKVNVEMKDEVKA